MSRMMFILTLTLLAGLSLLDLVSSTSDPAALTCESVCWDENALAEQCEADHGCDIINMTRSEFRACTRPCGAEVSACQRMCRVRFHRTYGRCTARCAEILSLNCVWECAVNNLLNFKAKRLERNNGTLVNRSRSRSWS